MVQGSGFRVQGSGFDTKQGSGLCFMFGKPAGVVQGRQPAGGVLQARATALQIEGVGVLY